MNYFTKDMSEFLTQRSLMTWRQSEESQRQALYRRLRDFYIGGKNCARYLHRLEGEQRGEFSVRTALFANLNYSARIADQFVSALYGSQPERTFGSSEPVNDAAKAIMDANSFPRKKPLLAQSQVVLGDGFEKVWFDGRASSKYDGAKDVRRIRFSPISPDRVFPIVDDEDSDTLKALLEERVTADYSGETGRSELTYILWDVETVSVLDRFGKVKEQEYHGYRRIPFAHYRGRAVVGDYLSLSLIEDVATIQEMLNNRVSMKDNLILMQAHGLLTIFTRAQKVKIETGTNRFLKLDPEDRVEYPSPNAKIAEVIESCGWLVDRMFEIGGVPVSAIRGGQASSGLQLALEFESMSNIVSMLQSHATEAERESWEMARSVAQAHGIGALDDMDFDCHFTDSYLPTDRADQFARDLLMVNNKPQPLMTLETFIDRWYSHLSPDQRKRLHDDLASRRVTVSPAQDMLERLRNGGG